MEANIKYKINIQAVNINYNVIYLSKSKATAYINYVINI